MKNNELVAKATTEMSETNERIHQNGEAVKQLIIASNAENQTLARLAEESQRGSRVLKVLTFVAMLYLPATLIAVTTSLALPRWLFPQSSKR